MEFLSVKNFEKFQHYHDRNPPWIKLYNSLLDDYLFAKLPDPQKYQLMALWLVASKTDNKIPNDTAWLKIELRATTSVNLDALIVGGWLEPWSPKKKEVWGSRYIPGEIKDSVWKRDLGKCVWCGRKTNIEFDHIVPVSRGGKSELNNLQLLCRQCNRKKHNKSESYSRSTDVEQVATVNDTQSRVETEIETEKSRVEKEIEKEGETLAPASPSLPQAKVKSDFTLWQEWFCNEFFERVGEKYSWQGAKDTEMSKSMLGSLGLETCKKRAENMFNTADDFILKMGFSIGTLSNQRNKLAVEPSIYDPKTIRTLKNIQEGCDIIRRQQQKQEEKKNEN